MNTSGISTHVHDERSLESLHQVMPLLRLAVGTPTLRLQTVQFARLKRDLFALPGELDAFYRNRAEDGWNLAALPNPAPLITSVPLSTWSESEPKAAAAGVPWNNLDFQGYADLEQRAGPVIASRNDPILIEVFNSFRLSVANAPEEVQQCVDYYSLFAPSRERFGQANPAVLTRFFRDIERVTDPSFGNIGNHVGLAWEVLRDPDPYYLRLRGEVHELARIRPDVPWLNYLFLIPDLFRIHARLLTDARVAPRSKRHSLAAITYLLLPLDFLPESCLGTAGYVEDVFLLSKALRDLIDTHSVSDGLLREHWSGGADRLDRLLVLVEQMREHLGFFRRLSEWFAIEDPRRG